MPKSLDQAWSELLTSVEKQRKSQTSRNYLLPAEIEIMNYITEQNAKNEIKTPSQPQTSTLKAKCERIFNEDSESLVSDSIANGSLSSEAQKVDNHSSVTDSESSEILCTGSVEANPNHIRKERSSSRIKRKRSVTPVKLEMSSSPKVAKLEKPDLENKTPISVNNTSRRTTRRSSAIFKTETKKIPVKSEPKSLDNIQALKSKVSPKSSPKKSNSKQETDNISNSSNTSMKIKEAHDVENSGNFEIEKVVGVRELVGKVDGRIESREPTYEEWGKSKGPMSIFKHYLKTIDDEKRESHIVHTKSDPHKRFGWQFRVKWRGYSSSRNTWEPLKSFCTLTAIQEFWIQKYSEKWSDYKQNVTRTIANNFDQHELNAALEDANSSTDDWNYSVKKEENVDTVLATGIPPTVTSSECLTLDSDLDLQLRPFVELKLSPLVTGRK